MRIGVIRESMLTFPGVKADEPIVQAATKEIKAILGDHLGATLVESVDPRWPDDPSIENMKTTYTRAIAELLPVFFPDILYRLRPDGTPMFPEFAAAIKPTEFAPGKTFGSGTMAPIDYMVGLAEGKIPPPANLNIRTIQPQAPSLAFRFHFVQYATPACGGLGGARVHRNADRFSDAQRTVEVLGRRPACGLQELGGGREHHEPHRAAGDSRTLPAPRVPAPRRDEGHAGEQARRGRPAPHTASPGEDWPRGAAGS